MRLAERHSISKGRADALIAEVLASIADWPEVARTNGVTHSSKEIQDRLEEIARDFEH